MNKEAELIAIILKLREALELIERTRPVVVMNGSAKMDDPQDVKTNYNTVFIARKALAQPTDDSALRFVAIIEKRTIERCAVEAYKAYATDEVIAAIRKLGEQ